MLTPENILLFIITTLLLINIQTILPALILYFYNLKEPKIYMIGKDDIEENIKEIVHPYEVSLKELGFEYQTQISTTPLFDKYNNIEHSFYYYHPIQGVHAFIDTTPIKGCLRPVSISYITFYEHQKMTISYDCFMHNIISLPENIYLFDHYFGSFEEAYKEHLKDRKIEGEKALRGALNQKGVYDYTKYMVEEMLESSIKENILKPTQDGYRFTASLPYLSHIKKSVKGYKKTAKILKKSHSRAEKDNSIEKQTLFYSSEQKALEQQLDIKPKNSSRQSKIKLFIVSGLSFVLFFGLIGIPWSVLPIIITVLIVHELGHFYAMKFFGYRDTSIFFIPLFGAAAKGEKEKTTPFEEYIVFLAGPLPGIIISITIGILMIIYPELRSNELLKEYAMMSLVLNYINLLPIFPLDGGKIVQTLLFTRYPKAQFYFFLISLMVIIISALMLKSILLGFFAVLLFLSINHHYKISQLIETVIKERNDTPIKEQVIKILTTDEKYKKESLAKKGSMAKQALKILHAKKPTPLLMILGLGFYLMIVLAPLAIKIVLSLAM